MRRISTYRYACTTMALALAALVLSLPGCGAIDIDGILGENTCLILNCDGILFIGEAEDGHDDTGEEGDEGGGHDDMEGMGDEGDEEDGHDDMGDEEDGHDEEDGATRSRSGTGTATGSS